MFANESALYHDTNANATANTIECRDGSELRMQSNQLVRADKKGLRCICSPHVVQNLPHVQVETWHLISTKSTSKRHSVRQRHPRPRPRPTRRTGQRTTLRLLRSLCGQLPRPRVKLLACRRQENQRTRRAPTVSRAFGSATCAAWKNAGSAGAPSVQRWAGPIMALLTVARPLSWHRASRAMIPASHHACLSVVRLQHQAIFLKHLLIHHETTAS